jgi:hypothetical protein
MNPRLAIVALLLGAALLSTTPWWWTSGAGGEQVTASEGDAVRALREQLAVLEDRNRLTMQRLAALEYKLDAADSEIDPAPAPAPVQEVAAVAEVKVPEPEEKTADPQRLQQIEEAGLTSVEFYSMEERAYELYLRGFEDEWVQRRESYLSQERVPGVQERLREDLGDDAYDRYLYASGGSNRVRIREVMRGSAAEAAGLANGDILLSYDNQRIFSFDDLRRSSYAGEPGDTVVLEVRRADNSVSQLIIPRGPMGVSGYRGWREVPDS